MVLPQNIFHLPYYIFHFSSQEVAIPAMADEKCDMANGE
jgi:hypothetical protein